MKVIQINSVCGHGSTGRIATDIHARLIESGYNSYIGYGRGHNNSSENFLKIGDKIDNYMHVAKTRIFDRHGFGSNKATKDFISTIESINPDLIHLHNIHGYYLNIELLFKYLGEIDKPIIWTLHDCWAFTGHCTHFEFSGCSKWKSECYDCPEKRMYPSSILIDSSNENFIDKRRLFNGVKNLTIITPSKWLANLVKESFLKNHQVIVIPNGINLDKFKPHNNKISVRKKYNVENKFVILGVSNIWNERKGWQRYLDLSKHLNPDEVIILVGVTEKQKKKLPRNIIGITRTNNVEEMSEIYSMANVFLNLTLEDNYPTVNLEARACGTQVITNDVGGAKETIENSSGIVISSEDSEEAILGIIRNNKKELKEIETNIGFDQNRMIEEYISLYSSLINKS